MAGETDDPEDAAARLEAALERIARHAAAHPVGDPSPEAGRTAGAAGDLSAHETGPDPPAEEIAARLDDLIDRLRAALTTSSGGRPV